MKQKRIELVIQRTMKQTSHLRNRSDAIQIKLVHHVHVANVQFCMFYKSFKVLYRTKLSTQSIISITSHVHRDTE